MIDGYVYDEESRAITNSSESGVSGKAGIKAVTGEGSKTIKLEFLNLHRDDFLEVLVTARFSKMKELTDSVVKLGEL